MSTDKKPGLLKDPWRRQVAPPPVVPKPRASLTDAAPPAVLAGDDDIDADTAAEELTTLEVKGYGGITIRKVGDIENAALRILDFCIRNNKAIEPILTRYGVVVAVLPIKPMPDIKFYVQRSDGWTLAIPGVASRDLGCVQLIQALMHVNGHPDLKKKLELYKITPYKH